MNIRNVQSSDLNTIRELVRKCEPLTLHTAVTYGVLFYHFSNLCFVAEEGSNTVGFVSAIRGSKPQSVYLWQIGVLPAYRGKGLSHSLIEAVVAAGKELACSSLQVGIEPSNEKSLAVFRSFASKQGQSLAEVGKIDFGGDPPGNEFDVVWEMPVSG